MSTTDTQFRPKIGRLNQGNYDVVKKSKRAILNSIRVKSELTKADIPGAARGYGNKSKADIRQTSFSSIIFKTSRHGDHVPRR